MGMKNIWTKLQDIKQSYYSTKKKKKNKKIRTNKQTEPKTFILDHITTAHVMSVYVSALACLQLSDYKNILTSFIFTLS